MTIENAIRIIKECREKGFHHTFYTVNEYHTALDMAIKALEQEPILDKIRAEIIEMRSKQNVGVLECLDIIDKYKGESEDKE